MKIGDKINYTLNVGISNIQARHDVQVMVIRDIWGGVSLFTIPIVLSSKRPIDESR